MMTMGGLKTLLCGLGFSLVLVVVSAALLIQHAIWDVSTLDPFDRFEVLDVVSDSRLQRHAAMYRYVHANSSATVTAVWILSGEPPSVGSKSPVRGNPVLVWTGSPQALRLSWQQAEERILVEVKGPADNRGQNFPECYLEDRSPVGFEDPVNLVCVDPKQIAVRISPVG